MEDLSFSLNEAKPKHFGLEMFALVVLVSWSLPCLLPFSFPVGLLPTGLHFPRSIPVTWRAEVVTHQGTWIYPGCLSSLCWNFSAWKRSPSVFWEASDENCAPGASKQRLLGLWGEVCAVLHPSCRQGCRCVCVTRNFPSPTRCCSPTNPFCCTPLQSWAHLKHPQPCFTQDFKLL